jgi:hypothetical protein
MKKALLLFVLIISFQLSAQQDELLNTTWHLHEVVVNEVSHPFEPDLDVPDTTLTFQGESNHTLMVYFCTSGQGNVIFQEETQDSKFWIEEVVFLAKVMCELQENQQYENLYFDFFWDTIMIEGYPYPIVDCTYEITGDDPLIRILTITNQNGNQLIYGSQALPMSVSDNQFTTISMYPNPVIDYLYFDSVDTLENSTVAIYTLSGAVCLEKTIGNENYIDLSSLNSGMYLMSFSNENGQRVYKKLIKK